MRLAFGVVGAPVERQSSGRGQVVDAAIVDGVSSLMPMFAGLRPAGRESMERDANLPGGGAPFYRRYRCADGREIAVGTLEPPCYAVLAGPLDRQEDARRGPADAAILAGIFATRDLAERVAMPDGTDRCVAPVVPLVADPQALLRRRCVEARATRPTDWRKRPCPPTSSLS